MSRTYKDQPRSVRQPYGWHRDMSLEPVAYWLTRAVEWDEKTMQFVTKQLAEPREYTRYRWVYHPTTKPKQRKRVDTEYHWMTTPGWFHHIFNNVPQRRRGRAWERKVLLEDLEDTDPPRFSKKPEKYYW